MLVWLLDHGADVNVVDTNNMSVLFHAIHEQCEDSALAILDHGVKVMDAILWCGRTVLHEAVRRGLPMIVQALLECGADPAVREFDQSNNPAAIELINKKHGYAAEEICRLLTEYTALRAATEAQNENVI